MRKNKPGARQRIYSKTLTTKQTEPRLDLEAEFYIDHCCRQFEETKDPTALMEAFIHSIHVGVYPPVPILQTISKAFQTVIDAEGKKTLDEVLGLKEPGKGGWPVFTRKRRESMVHWLASTMFALTTGYRLSVAEAAERVEFFLRSNPELKFYEADGLVQQYGQWKKRFRFDQADARSSLRPANWPPEVKASFIQLFKSPLDYPS